MPFIEFYLYFVLDDGAVFNLVPYIPAIFILGVVFGAVGLFVLHKCRCRKTLKLPYNYKLVGKEAVDKNLNIASSVYPKNFELMSYNEKKNVI